MDNLCDLYSYQYCSLPTSRIALSTWRTSTDYL